MKKVLFPAVLTMMFAHAQAENISAHIQDMLKWRKATIGVPVFNDTWGINRGRHFPMQSVFKLSIALDGLAEADRDTVALDQMVEITPQDLPYTN